MCGIIGIVGYSAVNQQIFDGLTVLQHRGQDSAGMVTSHNGRLILRIHNGLVREVFRTRHMQNLKGSIGIGHVRYPTAGTSSPHEAQPFYVNSPYGIVLVHNGNLLNDRELRTELFVWDQRHLNTDSDSEILLNVFAQELSNHSRRNNKIDPDTVFRAVCSVYERCKGGYSAIAMIVDHGIVAFRDPNGIRPLIYGARETKEGIEYCIASESCALKALNYQIIRDIGPGEVIYIENNGTIHFFQCYKNPIFSPCIFEYVYFARPDSIIDGVYVHKARMRMGIKLANKIKQEWSDYKDIIDVVIPIPSTSRIIALEMAHVLNLPYREGFTKNRYVGRTFIMPEQGMREKSVNQKLNTLDIEFKDKRVLLVDDSIVRGTTCLDIIKSVRESGAKAVYFASASPPIKYPNIYGIDIPISQELIAYNKTIEEIRKVIGADRLIYQDLSDLVASIREGNKNLSQFDCSVFDGYYVTGVSKKYFEYLTLKRNNKTKLKQLEENDGTL
jgi:amidophosphoribosyltransferase